MYPIKLVVIQSHDAVGHIVEDEENKSSETRVSSRPFIDFFKVDLRARVHEYSVLVRDGADADTNLYLNETIELHELLCSMARFPVSVDFEDERASACLRLIAYLQKTNRTDLFIRYTHALADLHRRLKNDAEAANSLMMHWEVLAWDSHKEVKELHVAGMRLPAGKECERKEFLMKKIIEHLDQGNEWERALELQEDMRVNYYQKHFRIDDIRASLTGEAEVWHRIQCLDRFQGNYPSFFSVSFFGQPFSEVVRNREFVYRGEAFEMTRDFRSRILLKYSKEQVQNIKSLDDAVVNEAKASHSMKVNFSTVRPCRLMRDNMDEIDQLLAQKKPSSVVFEEIPLKENMPDRMKTHVCNSGISVFVHTRSFSKRKQSGLPKSKNEFLDLWISTRYLFCSNSLPSTNRRTLVKDVRTVESNPLEVCLCVPSFRKHLQPPRSASVPSWLFFLSFH